MSWAGPVTSYDIESVDLRALHKLSSSNKSWLRPCADLKCGIGGRKQHELGFPSRPRSHPTNASHANTESGATSLSSMRLLQMEMLMWCPLEDNEGGPAPSGLGLDLHLRS